MFVNISIAKLIVNFNNKKIFAEFILERVFYYKIKMEFISLDDVEGWLLESGKYKFQKKNYPNCKIRYPKGLYRVCTDIRSLEDFCIFHKISIFWNIQPPFEFFKYLYSSSNMLDIILNLKKYIDEEYYNDYIKLIVENCKENENALLKIYNITEPVFSNLESEHNNYYKLLSFTQDLPLFN